MEGVLVNSGLNFISLVYIAISNHSGAERPDPGNIPEKPDPPMVNTPDPNKAGAGKAPARGGGPLKTVHSRRRQHGAG